MRIDFRRNVLLSIGLVVTSTLISSELMAAPAHAFVRHPSYLGIHREAIAGPAAARAARQRASRSGVRQPLPPAPAPAPKPVFAASGSGGDDPVWQRIRNCEAGGRYDRNSGNGYYGAYQMSAGTWRSLGYSGLPHEAPPDMQDEAARKLQKRSGWGQWPACSRRVGAR
jgi:hypothetical protein